MRVKFLIPFGAFRRGQVVDLPDGVANVHLNLRRAEKVGRKSKRKPRRNDAEHDKSGRQVA